MSISDAFANVRRAQERLNCWPDVLVAVNSMPYCMSKAGTPAFVLSCTLPDDLLQRILRRETHWNNAEIGCLIRFDRMPNVYLPDVHTLMSFFHG